MQDDDMSGDEFGPTDDFWGATPDWSGSTRRPRRERSAGRGDVTGAIKGLWSSAMSKGFEGTREHGVIDATAPRPSETESVLDSTMFDDLDTEIPVSPSGRVAVFDVDDHDTFDVDARDRFDTDVHRDAPVAGDFDTLNATTEVPVVDVEADAADFAEMAPIAIADRDDTRLGASRSIDPLLVRVGAVAVVTTLLVPLMIGLTSGDGDDDTVASATTVELAVVAGSAADPAVPDADVPLDPDSLPPAVPVNPPPTDADETPASAGDAASTSGSDADDATDPVAVESDAASGDSGSGSGDASAPSAAVVVDSPASADDGAERILNCAIDYEVEPGDFWLRLAEGANVSLAELLEANGATINTPLYPGASICLPAGSSTPSPPAAPTTAAPTTVATTTTTTTTTTTVAPAGPEEVKQIIRDVWPDELEERALEIAFRESRYVPTAKNFCCYGLFQIYWSVHKGWLAGLGITSDQQLYDPETNARAAYALYQRSGGWGPWGF